MKYGLMIGRLQPFHFGHQHIVNEIMLDGLRPLIAIGSINNNRDVTKNPLSFQERKDLIQTLYPTEVDIVGLYDFADWTDWFENVVRAIEFVALAKPEDVTLYYHNKEVDRTTFEFRGKVYENTFYTEIFKEAGFNMKKIEFVDRKDFMIDSNARDIRSDIEGFKHFLDARIYHKLKQKGW
jgi:nicotinamide mononucleotide adenylyltransferase